MLRIILMKRSEDRWWRLRSRPPLQEFNLGQPMLFSFSHGLIHRRTSLVLTVHSVAGGTVSATGGGNPAPWSQFLSALTGRQPLSNVERELINIALPAHFKGLGIPIPTHSASHNQGAFASHSTSDGLSQLQHK